MKLKICGMNQNTEAVAALAPEYLGFIFWEPSKRSFQGPMPELPDTLIKTGVFVNAPIEAVLEKTAQNGLKAIQLHGREDTAYCQRLYEEVSPKNIRLIKVFSVGPDFDFKELTPFETVCDFYLFDTKGKLPGGNGQAFDWSVLAEYPSQKPFFLSGGIGPDDLDRLTEFYESPAAAYCHAIDVNSRFETAPGLKDIEKLSYFIQALKQKGILD